MPHGHAERGDAQHACVWLPKSIQYWSQLPPLKIIEYQLQYFKMHAKYPSGIQSATITFFLVKGRVKYTVSSHVFLSTEERWELGSLSLQVLPQILSPHSHPQQQVCLYLYLYM